MGLLDPVVVFIVGTYLYYKPVAQMSAIEKQPTPGKYPGHVNDLLNVGHQWFEDPLFFFRVK